MSTVEQAVEDLLSEQDWTGKIFSDGWVDAPETIETVEPATGEVLGTAGVANAASVAAATKSAARAQREWAALPMAERVAVITRAAELLERHRAEIAGWMVRESGAIPPKVEHEIGASIGQLNEAASLISSPLEQELTSPIPGRTSTARRAPIGVVGVITPWNFPIVLAMRSLGPALVLGNAVVLKSDPNTPVTGGVIIARIFEEAGLPSGVLHVLCGGPEIGQALVEDPNVRMISFTGSTKTGRVVGETAGRGLKRVVLELGGNCPLIVLEDADIEAASSAGAWGSFLHQGQICLAVSRHLVHESIAEEYLAALTERAARLPVGNPAAGEVALGPMINEKQIERVQRIVDETVAAGATVVVGGSRDGMFFPPTVLRDVRRGWPPSRRRSSARWPRSRPSRPTTRPSSWRTRRSTASRPPFSPEARSGPTLSQRASRRAWSTSTTRPSTRSRRRRSAASSARATVATSAASGQLELWTEWQWLTSREKAGQFPF